MSLLLVTKLMGKLYSGNCIPLKYWFSLWIFCSEILIKIGSPYLYLASMPLTFWELRGKNIDIKFHRFHDTYFIPFSFFSILFAQENNSKSFSSEELWVDSDQTNVRTDIFIPLNFIFFIRTQENRAYQNFEMVIKYTEALRFNLSKMKSEIDEMRTRYEVDHPGGSREHSISTTTTSSEYSTAREDKSNTQSDFPRTGKHNFLFIIVFFLRALI